MCYSLGMYQFSIHLHMCGLSPKPLKKGRVFLRNVLLINDWILAVIIASYRAAKVVERKS